MYWRFVAVFIAIALCVQLVEHQKKVNEQSKEFIGRAIAALMISKGIKNYFGS